MIHPLLEKFRSTLSKINWQNFVVLVLYSAFGIACAGILLLFVGVLIVGHPQPPPHENLGNALITLGTFLIAGIAIYTFRGGGCRKK